MITYLLQTSGCLILFYSAYHIFLRKLTFFEFNRWYLIGSILISLILPYAGPSLIINKPEVLNIYYISSQPIALSAGTQLMNQGLFTLVNTIYCIYFIGLGFKLLRFAIGLLKIRNMATEGDKITENNLSIIYTNKPHLPFSFLNKIFISRKTPLQGDFGEVLLHEKAHISRLHSLDILFLELVYAVFWFNPIFIFYKKALKQSHEYLADAIVTNEYDKNNYKQLLLNHTVSGLQMELTNQFFNSQIKKRLEMMDRKSSSKTNLYRYLLLFPLILILGAVFASNGSLKEELHSSSLGTYLDTIDENNLLEQMPAFPGCGELPTEKQRRDCTHEKLLAYLYEHIEYPKKEREKGITGSVEAIFSVRDDGQITGLYLRGIAGNLGQAVMKALGEMSTMGERWTPGKYKGQNVNARYTLPVNFILQKDVAAEIKEKEALNVVAYGTHRKNIQEVRDAEVFDNSPETYPIYILNDKRITHEEYQTINRDYLKTTTALYRKEALAQYGDEAIYGAHIMTTKEGFLSQIYDKQKSISIKLIRGHTLYILDGAEIDLGIAVQNGLFKNKDFIKTTRLSEEEAIEKFGTKGENGAVVMSTVKE